jgi:hypothetical protein
MPPFCRSSQTGKSSESRLNVAIQANLRLVFAVVFNVPVINLYISISRVIVILCHFLSESERVIPVSVIVNESNLPAGVVFPENSQEVR